MSREEKDLFWARLREYNPVEWSLVAGLIFAVALALLIYAPILLIVEILCFFVCAEVFFVLPPKKRSRSIDPNTDLRLVYLDPDEELMRLRKMREETPMVLSKAKPRLKPVQHDIWSQELWRQSVERTMHEKSRPFPAAGYEHGTCFCPECEAKRSSR
jgi:hypothetical protein